MKLFTATKSTELGPCTILVRDRAREMSLKERWLYARSHPTMNIRFDAVSKGAEGFLYEIVMVKKIV